MPKVTIAIPTYNRADFLKEAVESVLNQTYKNFELLISDNASTDDTKNVIGLIKDSRITYYRNRKNIGMMENWNKCLKLAKGKYLMILGDDDKLHPHFLESSLSAHKVNPEIGFSYTHCNKVDFKGNYLTRWGYKFAPSGYLKLFRYLYFTIKFGSCITNSSTVLINKKVFSKVGQFKSIYGTNTFDFNMWIKIALKYPVYFVDEVLCDYRIHTKQISELHWRSQDMPTGQIGTHLEIVGAISELLLKKEFRSPENERFLAKKLLWTNRQLSYLLKRAIPHL